MKPCDIEQPPNCHCTRELDHDGPCAVVVDSTNDEDHNTVFVFGSNLAGYHGAGAALAAKNSWDAEMGVGIGRTGDAYAIPTKDENLRTLSLKIIEFFVNEFKTYARKNPDLMFYVTPIGCGLAGYKRSQIRPLFYNCTENCVFAHTWFECDE